MEYQKRRDAEAEIVAERRSDLMARHVSQQAIPAGEKCGRAACTGAAACLVECLQPGCGPYFCADCDLDVHFGGEGSARFHDRRGWNGNGFFQTMKSGQYFTGDDLVTMQKTLNPDLACKSRGRRDGWTATMSHYAPKMKELLVMTITGIHTFACGTFLYQHCGSGPDIDLTKCTVSQSSEGVGHVNRGFFPASLTRSGVRVWISVELFELLELVRTKATGMSDHSMATTLSEVGQRRRRAPKVDPHLLGTALDEYLR